MNIIYSILFNLMIFVLSAVSFLLVNDKFRKNYWKGHLVLGWSYFIISAFISVYIVVNTFQRSYGHVAESGMRIAALLWMFYLVQGFRFMLKRRVFAHRIWMKRVLFMNLAVLLAPIFLAVFELFGDDFPLYIALSYTLNVVVMLVVSTLVLNKKQIVIKN